ncbi:hypothetical protein ABZ942_20170 [Nocardia sp. NPDC046473]|uniref:hypothetical protein n=1 Tax=Nocardia sp. NPDC046473 TaxID=3155733 RepID=UPI0033FD592C
MIRAGLPAISLGIADAALAALIEHAQSRAILDRGARGRDRQAGARRAGTRVIRIR